MANGDHPIPGLDKEILAYYERGGEVVRLREGVGRLEFLRTQELLRRLLPPAPARVLDIGGATGVHAEWLVADGYTVELVDPVPSHVERAARLPGVTARVGDARALDAPDDSVDVALLLGPLYHLPDRTERVRAITQACRVVRPGGLVVVATINRYAGLLDSLDRGFYFDPERRPRTEAVARNGVLRGSEHAIFTTAYFHHPQEVVDEFAAAGLHPEDQYSVEGVVWLMGGILDWLDDPEWRDLLLRAVRLTETEPTLLGAAGHVLTVGRVP